jgi:hypothetical protein
MKKLLLTVLIGCALLSMAPMAVHATAPAEVSGTIAYVAHVKVYEELGFVSYEGQIHFDPH